MTRRFLGLAVAMGALLIAGRAGGTAPSSPRLKLGGVDLVVLPGPSRAVPHHMSAARDTAVLGAQFFPYTTVSAGGDFAVLGLFGRQWEERIGIFGLIELHGACAWKCDRSEPTAFLWRGLFGGSLALSAEHWGQKLFGPGGKLEFTLSIRHESEHATAGVTYPITLPAGNFVMGDFVMPDVAVRIPVKKLDIEFRAQTKIFIPSRLNTSTPDTFYKVGPGIDAIVRWRIHDVIHPFSSTFFEYVVGDSVAAKVQGAGADAPFVKVHVPDLYLLRTQLGGILVTGIGDLQLFTFLEVGHGEGVLKFYEEVRWGLGTRGVLIR